MRARIGPLTLVFAALCLGGAVSPDAAINIDNFAFSSADVTVAPGTTVAWTNRDDIPHTVTAASFRSGPLDTDERFSFRFDTGERFRYFCSLHPHMQGVVVVR